MPTSPDDPAVPANREAWRRLGEWEKPFLTLFGAGDPILGKADRPLQAHGRVRGGHVVQEDAGVEIARRTLDWSGR